MHVTCTHTALPAAPADRGIARDLPAHRRPIAPASEAPKVIGLKGAPHGLHDDSLGWMKISTFEREETVHFLSTAGGDVLGAPRVARGL